MESGNILATLLPNLPKSESGKKIERRTLSQVERELIKNHKGSGESLKPDDHAPKSGHQNARKKKRPKKKSLVPQNNNDECTKTPVVEVSPMKNEVTEESKSRTSTTAHVKENTSDNNKNGHPNGQSGQENHSTSPQEKKKTKHQFAKRHKKKDKTPSCASPSLCRNCGKSPTADPIPREDLQSAEASNRPRDSPSRYDFRKLTPGSPLLSENADGEGYLTVQPKPLNLQDMTAYALMQSPLQNGKVNGKAFDLAKNSPLTSGNLTQAARELLPVNKDFENSPPSSSSTMSSTNINQLLSEIHDSPQKKAAKEANEKLISREIRSNTQGFAPVDVTKNGSYIFCVSQATNDVEVFGTDGKKVGKLRPLEKENFVTPRNILHVPHCQWVEDTKGEHMALKAGCIVVLDSEGFHIFAENGRHLGCVLEGSGFKFRGLGVYKSLYLVTIDISGKDGVHLVMIDLKQAMKKTGTEVPRRILLTQLPDKSVKCRFVTTTFLVNSKEENHYAYVTAMLTKDVFKINLQTGSVEKMRLFCEPKGSSTEATFVQEKTILEQPITLQEPTGITVDKAGNILIADRAKNKIEVFDPKGLHLCSVFENADVSSERSDISSPIGIHLNPVDGQLFIASNMNKVILSCDFYDDFSRLLK